MEIIHQKPIVFSFLTKFGMKSAILSSICEARLVDMSWELAAIAIELIDYTSKT